MDTVNDMQIMSMCICLLSVLISITMLLGININDAYNKGFNRALFFLMCANIILNTGEFGLHYFNGKSEHIALMKIATFLSFSFGYVMVSCFGYCIAYFTQNKKIGFSLANIISVMNGAVILLSIISVFNGQLYYIDLAGNYCKGPWYNILHVFDVIFAVMEVCIAGFYIKKRTVGKTLALMSVGILPAVSLLILPEWDPIPQYAATTLAILIIYILFNKEISLQLREREKELEESRISIMISQIQPHFLYNSLNAIRELCRINPEKARQALTDFSKYLRGNMDSLSNAGPILFSNELSHIKNYLNLEQLRLGDDLRVVYDIKEDDFYIPALSIQPLVENAVKHGIFNKVGGGTVTIKTFEEDDDYIIEITDDGIGFDTENPKSGDLSKRSHIGLKNTKNRIVQISGGSLEIKSKPGKGTTATVKIPK